MKIYASSFGKLLFIIARARCMAINYALKILFGMIVSLQV